METVKIEALTFTYPGQSKPALDSAELSVEKGEFFVIFGLSGSGKSTLLRHLKPAVAPCGEKTGRILFNGADITSLSDADAAAKIGFVTQSPEKQLVTDKVWHELAFGLESLGADNLIIRRRTAEMAAFFGIEDWYYKDVCELSGGQKQLLCLASVLTLSPDIIILDEPTSQLDPIAASDFMNVLAKVNRELGVTVLLSEHRLEEALAYADKTALIDNGSVVFSGTPAEMGRYLKNSGSGMFSAMPAAVRIWGALETDEECPVTVNAGRTFLEKYFASHTPQKDAINEKIPVSGTELVKASSLWFRYDKNGADIIKGLSFSVRAGELFCIMGGNGTGKTTSLKLVSGLLKPYRGTLEINGKTGFLPQDPQSLFVKKTVYEELWAALSDSKLSSGEKKKRISETAALCGITRLYDRHPYDISGGEQQRTALAEVLLGEPDVLLLDEPTKGLDTPFREKLAGIITALRKTGKAVILVSHDVEFCAACADRCGLFFDGSLTAVSSARGFFTGNSFYTTAANRMIRNIEPRAVTVEDVILVSGGRLPEKSDEPDDIRETVPELPENEKKKKLPLWRSVAAGITAAASAGLMIYSSKTGSISRFVSSAGMTDEGRGQLVIEAAVILLLLVTALFLGKSRDKPDFVFSRGEKRRPGKRTVAACVLILLFIPLTLFAGARFFDGKQYYLTAAAVLIECMLPFFLVFEGRRPSAREIVTVATLCALSVAGRTVFFMLPQFKPVMALSVIAGVAFGGETGFLVGAVSMLVSNMLFSQGPWTPWQMFAMGLVGLVAGIAYRAGFLSRSRGSLAVFGAVAAMVIYGGIMNPTALLIWGGETINLRLVLGYYITGLPMDIIHAVSTAVFLWFAGVPLLEKLDRLKIKYGMIKTV